MDWEKGWDDGGIDGKEGWEEVAMMVLMILKRTGKKDDGKEVRTIDGSIVGVDEWLSLGSDDGMSVHIIVGVRDSLRGGCKEEIVVGSDEEYLN